MRTRLSLFFGIFAVMALSNAIVPVLPHYAGESAVQGAIYAAYFLGAFVTTLIGRHPVRPVWPCSPSAFRARYYRHQRIPVVSPDIAISGNCRPSP